MSKTTQEIENLIDFDDLLNKCFKNLDEISAFKRQMVYRIILSLGLTTGLQIEIILGLKWRDLISNDNGYDIIVKNELATRKYLIPIHPKVRELIYKMYFNIGHPNIDSLIIDSIPIKERLSEEMLVRNMIMSGSSNMRILYKMDNETLNGFNFQNFTQVLFGRKVFEANGYSNELSKDLKQHFGFRLNEELFDFLGYKSKEDIKYELSNVNLKSKNVIIELEDKSFHNKHPFQKFNAFSDFLTIGNVNSLDSLHNSIRMLLLISLYTGIRPSTLIRLKWEDVLEIDEIQNTVDIKSSIPIDGFVLKTTQEIRDGLLIQLEKIHRNLNNEWLEETSARYQIKNKLKSQNDKNPALDTHIFVMNSGNPITQPSLSREIKKVMQQIGFPHPDKITTKSTSIMFGRRIIEIKGDHKATIDSLKDHFNFRSKKELFDFLYIEINHKKKEFRIEDKVREPMFEEILYDL